MARLLPGSRSTVTTVTAVVKSPRALRNSDDESEEVGILEVFEDTILGARKAKQWFRAKNALSVILDEHRDLKRGESSWRGKSRLWAERERKAPGWRIAWRKLVSTF